MRMNSEVSPLVPSHVEGHCHAGHVEDAICSSSFKCFCLSQLCSLTMPDGSQGTWRANRCVGVLELALESAYHTQAEVNITIISTETPGKWRHRKKSYVRCIRTPHRKFPLPSHNPPSGLTRPKSEFVSADKNSKYGAQSPHWLRI